MHPIFIRILTTLHTRFRIKLDGLDPQKALAILPKSQIRAADLGLRRQISTVFRLGGQKSPALASALHVLKGPSVNPTYEESLRKA